MELPEPGLDVSGIKGYTEYQMKEYARAYLKQWLSEQPVYAYANLYKYSGRSLRFDADPLADIVLPLIIRPEA